MRHIAEMSLSLLTDDNLARLKRNGFVGMLPGIESWYDYGNKSKATRVSGAAKVEQVADHVNRIARPYPVRPDQLHPRPRLRRGRRAVRADQAVHRPDAGRLSGFLAVHLLRPRLAAQPRAAARRAGQRDGVPLPRQQSRHEHQAAPLRLGRFLRPRRRRDPPRYGARAHLAAASRERARTWPACSTCSAAPPPAGPDTRRRWRGCCARTRTCAPISKARPRGFPPSSRRGSGRTSARSGTRCPPGALGHDPYAYLNSQVAAAGLTRACARVAVCGRC